MDIAILTAQRLREKYNHCPNSTLIGKIIADHHIVVDAWPYTVEKFAGCLLKYNDEWTIVINMRQSPNRKLFTIAHELGHYFLHRHQKSQFTCHIEQSYRLSRLEQEANRFAAELLMPAETIYKYLQQQYPQSRIANLLGVSESAVKYRIQKLPAP